MDQFRPLEHFKPLDRPKDLPDLRLYFAKIQEQNPHAQVPENVSDALQLGIYFHDHERFDWAVYFLSVAAAAGDAFGLILFAIHLRHGWGISKDEVQATRVTVDFSDKEIVFGTRRQLFNSSFSPPKYSEQV